MSLSRCHQYGHRDVSSGLNHWGNVDVGRTHQIVRDGHDVVTLPHIAFDVVKFARLLPTSITDQVVGPIFLVEMSQGILDARLDYRDRIIPRLRTERGVVL